MKEKILQTENLSYSYQDQIPALDGINFSLYKGERVAVLGNNGAGKSTFFLCLNGILHPQKGRLWYGEQEIRRTKKDLSLLRRKVGIVFQQPEDQIIASTVYAEVSFGPMNLGYTRQQAQQAVSGAIEAMHLTSLEDRPPQYLSGGEKKRVTIADVLAMDPEILLMDEPTASLDPANTQVLEDNLRLLHEQGFTIMISTHDVDFAYRWAERFLVFHKGKLVADGDAQHIFSNEPLLKEAGLKKPLLYDVATILGEGKDSPFPRTVEELARWQHQVRSKRMGKDEKTMKQAIVVVSFGTTHEDTAAKTIGAVEEEIRRAYPEYRLEKAYTSSIVRRILAGRGIEVDGVEQALERLADDGVESVWIQPTHLIPGEEYDKLCEKAGSYRERFDTLKIGTPLLYTILDCEAFTEFITTQYHLDSDTALVLMGHGTAHKANAVYPHIDGLLQEKGHSNVFVGTVEGSPGFEQVLEKLEELHPKKVVLAPLMLVAGDHAVNDMAGDEPDSWKNILTDKGYEVSVILKGLGEFPEVRAQYLAHVRDLLKN